MQIKRITFKIKKWQVIWKESQEWTAATGDGNDGSDGSDGSDVRVLTGENISVFMLTVMAF